MSLAAAVAARSRATQRLADAEAELERAEEALRATLAGLGWVRLHGAFAGALWTRPDSPGTFTTDEALAEEAPEAEAP